MEARDLERLSQLGGYVPTSPGVVGWIVLELHDTGAMGISGNIGDTRMALGMIDGAREALARRLPSAPLVVPSVDVPTSPDCDRFPLVAVGDR